MYRHRKATLNVELRRVLKLLEKFFVFFELKYSIIFKCLFYAYFSPGIHPRVNFAIVISVGIFSVFWYYFDSF